MTETPRHILQALDDLEGKLGEAQARVTEIKSNINKFCTMFGLPPRYEIDGSQASAPTQSGLRNDEFTNFPTPSAAVKHLLKLRGQERGAVDLWEAFEILRDHGFDFDPKKSEQKNFHSLKVAVGKDHGITRIGDSSVGLVDWYPRRRKTRDKGGTENSEGENGPRNEDQGDEPKEDTTDE